MLRRIILICLLVCIYACSNNSFNGRVVKLREDPLEQQMTGKKILSVPGAGIIYIAYPYLLISTYNLPYFLKVVDLCSYATAGLFAIKGNGPEEFLSFKIINQTYPDDGLFLAMDYYKKQVYTFRPDELMKEMKLTVKPVGTYFSTAEPFHVFDRGDEHFLIKSYDRETNEMIYLITGKEDTGRISKKVSTLYKEPLSLRNLDHMLTVADGYEISRDLIVSLSGNRQIDIIDIGDPANNRSFFPPPYRERIPVQKLSSLDPGKDSYYISLPRFNKDKIMALYKTPAGIQFHITDWNGNTFHRIHLTEDIRDFNMDWENKTAYGISTGEDIYTYDLGKII